MMLFLIVAARLETGSGWLQLRRRFPQTNSCLFILLRVKEGPGRDQASIRQSSSLNGNEEAQCDLFSDPTAECANARLLRPKTLLLSYPKGIGVPVHGLNCRLVLADLDSRYAPVLVRFG